MQLTRFILIVSAFLATFSVSSMNAEQMNVRVIMSNGDVFSGEVVSETDEFIELKSIYAGVLRLPQNQVSGVHEPDGTVPKDGANEEGSVAKKPVTEAKGHPDRMVGEGTNQRTSSPNGSRRDVRTVAPIDGSVFRYIFLENWDKRLELGLTTQSGSKDKSDYVFRYKMQREIGADGFLAEAKYLYGKTNSSVTTDKISSNFRWRHDIAPGIFYESNSSYYSDTVKQIDYILDQKVGLGYRFIETAGMKLSTGVGASVRLRNDLTRDNEREELVDVFQDWEYRLNGKVKISQDMRFATLVDDADAYEIGFAASLTSSLSKATKMNLRYEIEYDNTLPKDSREDHRLVSSLAYDF